MVDSERAAQMTTVTMSARRLVKECSEKTGVVDIPSIVFSLSYLHAGVTRDEIQKLVLEIVDGSQVSVLQIRCSAPPRTLATGRTLRRHAIRTAVASI